MPQPITTFRRYELELKSAMTKCMDSPSSKAVHRLRSTTRRLEATLELLILTAGLTALSAKSKAFRKSLGKLRRTAGHVRDLDVHLELLAANKAASDMDRLKHDLAAARTKKSVNLQHRIKKDKHEILRALDKLERTLAPKSDLELSGGAITDAAQNWLTPAIHGLDLQSNDDLHSIRKACKTGRYIAKIGKDASEASSGLANRLDDIQRTIGAWHDYLLLLHQVRQTLPDDRPIVQQLHTKVERLRHRAETKAARLLIR
jgi:CHAD domain-containing protein